MKKKITAEEIEQALLSSGEAAEELCVTPRWLRQLAARGDIPCIVLSGARFYLMADLREWERHRPLVGRPVEKKKGFLN